MKAESTDEASPPHATSTPITSDVLGRVEDEWSLEVGQVMVEGSPDQCICTRAGCSICCATVVDMFSVRLANILYQLTS